MSTFRHRFVTEKEGNVRDLTRFIRLIAPPLHPFTIQAIRVAVTRHCVWNTNQAFPGFIRRQVVTAREAYGFNVMANFPRFRVRRLRTFQRSVLRLIAIRPTWALVFLRTITHSVFDTSIMLEATLVIIHPSVSRLTNEDFRFRVEDRLTIVERAAVGHVTNEQPTSASVQFRTVIFP